MWFIEFEFYTQTKFVSRNFSEIDGFVFGHHIGVHRDDNAEIHHHSGTRTGAFPCQKNLDHPPMFRQTIKQIFGGRV